MKVQDIFCLVVRLSGYFVILFAAVTILGMVIGPVAFKFKAFMYMVAYAALGAAIIKLAPVVGAFAYPDDPAA